MSDDTPQDVGEPVVKRSPGRSKRQEEVKVERRRRGEMSEARFNRLYVPEDQKDPDFHFHWINDTPGRIHSKTELDDYDIVTEESLRGGEGEGEGTPVRRAIGTGPSGEWLYAYLCRKPKKYHDADKAKEQEVIDTTVQQMKQGNVGGTGGLGTQDHGYVPEGRTNVIE